MIKKMKYSGVEWIGEIPEKWNVGKVRHAFQSNKSVAGEESDNYPRLSLSNAGVIERDKYNGVGESPADYATYQIIPKGQFVFNFMGLEQDADYRRVGIAPKTGIVSAGYLEANYNESIVDPLFSYYFFRFMESERLFKQYGSGIRSNLNKNQFLKMPFIFPDLQRQKVIGEFLERKNKEIDNIIKEAKESIIELKKYKQSVITESVTKGLDINVEMKDSGIEYIGKIPESWVLIKLKRILRTNLQYGANESGINGSADLPRYIRITDILDNNTLTSENKLSLSMEKAESYLLTEGDLLFARSGASVGKTFLVEKDNVGDTFAGYLIKAQFNSSIIPKFVYYYTLSSPFENWKNSVTIQATIQNIGAEKYGSLPISLPIKKEQQEIVSFLDTQTQRIEKLIQEKRKVIEELEQYKKSLIYEYVTGKKEV